MRKPQELLDLKVDFNDKFMRETGIDVCEDNDYIFWMDDSAIMKIKDRFIKYSDEMYPMINPTTEIEMNLLWNPRLTERLTAVYLQRRVNNKILSMTQDKIRGSNYGHFIITFDRAGRSAEIVSDPFMNESVRIFNLICKINKTAHLYDFNMYDVPLSEIR